MSSRRIDLAWLAVASGTFFGATAAHAQTPGYPEKVVQWTVKSGESCEDIAQALYGSSTHKRLVQRYNSVSCTPGAPLKNGMTLVLPAKVTTLPTAKITSVKQETKARPSGGSWSTAYAGQPLGKSSSVNTRTKGRAGLQFRDRTRVYLAEHTLVIIYGTASQTQVSKTPPPAVKLETGELQAGLAALRGRPVGIAVEGGGRVDAASKDAVVAKKGKRTNVSVFQGNAKVKSAGVLVKVPTNYGTRFVEKKAPEKPRPLPPAPLWQKGGSGSVVFAVGGKGTLAGAWSAVPNTKRYRVEVARDADFRQLVIRQHVPAKVRAFRAEQLPSGRYFVRARAIDNDDFLGIASKTRNVELVGAKWTRGVGTPSDAGLTVGRYAILKLAPAPELELAVDAGPFGPLPKQLDFRRLDAKTLKLRRAGGTAQDVPVTYVDPNAKLTVDRKPGRVTVTVTFANVAGLDVKQTLDPKAHVLVGEQRIPVALSAVDAHTFRGEVPITQKGSLSVFVRDDFGRTVAHSDVHDDIPEEPAPDKPVDPEPQIPVPGAELALVSMSPRTSVLWTSPTAKNMGALGVRLAGVESPTAAQGFVYASGHFDILGIDAMVNTPAAGTDEADSTAQVGLRVNAYQRDDGTLSLGPWLRVGFPLDDLGPATRVEPGFAIGGVVERWTWLANAGARIKLAGDDHEGALVDPAQVFGLAGGSFAPLPWLRLSSVLDVHALIRGGDASALGRGGLTLGAEAGERWFVGGGVRATPWDDMGGHVAGQLQLGFREY